MTSEDWLQAQAVGPLIRTYARRDKVPPGLAERIGVALEAEARQAPRTTAAFRPRRVWRPLALAASLLLTISLASGTTWFVTESRQQTAFADELVASYARSRLTDHVTDIPSSDQHTVRPWLAARLDIAPPVFDFADRGFPLLGGRLDYVNHKVVGVTVYKRGLHVINVFSWPVNQPFALPATTPASLRGYNLRSWTAGGFTFWAVSDADPKQLEKLEARFCAALPTRTSSLEKVPSRKPTSTALYIDMAQLTPSPAAAELRLLPPSAHE